MFTDYLHINTIYQTSNLISCTSQAESQSYRKQINLRTSHIITSNKLDNLLHDSLDIENFKIEDLELKLNKPGNTLMFPLFEVKNKNEKEIQANVVKCLGFNKINLNDGLVVYNKNSCGITTQINIKLSRKKTTRIIKPSVFILEHPVTEKLTLYLFVTIDRKKSFTYEQNVLLFGSVKVDSLSLTAWGEIFETFEIDLDSKDKYEYNNYKASSPTEKNTIYLTMKFPKPNIVSIIDSNVYERAIIIKPPLSNEGQFTPLPEKQHVKQKKVRNLDNKDKLYIQLNKESINDEYKCESVLETSQDFHTESTEEQVSDLKSEETKQNPCDKDQNKAEKKTIKELSKENIAKNELNLLQKKQENKDASCSKNTKLGWLAVIPIVLITLVIVIYISFFPANSFHEKKNDEL
ncbi:hypothetical protein CDIK_3414 [Cucumispora dikerogammari]|nr:hypothetical protein CDIK_3414 [Cucumispora dikerogammari]